MLSKEIVDLILFGSLIKKGAAADIDIALVMKDKKEAGQIKKKIKKIIKNPDIEVIDIESIYSPIWLTLIKEGFSIKKNKFISELYKINSSVLFKYSLIKLNPVQKVQFERGLKNVLGKEGTYLTRSVILVPMKIKNEVIDLLKNWNIYYESQEYELLPAVRKETFL